MKNNIYPDYDEAVADIPDGATLMMHCFSGLAGIAQNLIRALRDKGTRDLTLIVCSPGTGFFAGTVMTGVVMPSHLVANKQVKKVVTGWVNTTRSYAATNPLEEAVSTGEVAIELVGQGTLAERIRAGGCGIGAFYCPVGVSTILEEGKEKRIIDGREYLLEYPLRANFGFVRAHKADKMGNLVYRGGGRSYNPLIAMACDVVIAEVDEIVEVGDLDPEVIVTPGIFVDRIVAIRDCDLGSAAHRKKIIATIRQRQGVVS